MKSGAAARVLRRAKTRARPHRARWLCSPRRSKPALDLLTRAERASRPNPSRGSPRSGSAGPPEGPFVLREPHRAASRSRSRLSARTTSTRSSGQPSGPGASISSVRRIRAPFGRASSKRIAAAIPATCRPARSGSNGIEPKKRRGRRGPLPGRGGAARPRSYSQERKSGVCSTAPFSSEVTSTASGANERTTTTSTSARPGLRRMRAPASISTSRTTAVSVPACLLDGRAALHARRFARLAPTGGSPPAARSSPARHAAPAGRAAFGRHAGAPLEWAAPTSRTGVRRSRWTQR